MRRRSLLLCTTLAASAVGAGCGGGGSGGGGGGITKAEFVKRADAVCAKASADVNALGTPKSIRDLGRLSDKAKGIAAKEVADVRALGAPKGDETQVRAMLAAVERSIAVIGRVAEAAKAGNSAKVQQILTEAQTDTERARRLAQAYGLKRCAQ